MLKIIFFLFIFIFMSLPVSGEYYQYKDADGNMVFTDDVANVPAEDRSDLTVYESVGKLDFETPSEVSDNVASDSSIQETVAGNGEELSVESLNVMRETLDQTAASLKAEHEELAAQNPGVNASKLQRVEYNNKVIEINSKMADYKKQHQAYNEKVRAYNARISLENKKKDSGQAK
ncbi:MAG: DUF4124 domain-containing protein [Desulfobacteraceae bacterium]|jgi:hypothetical protein|nr:DUF4124 domain-containing protein [Desulfobacteraceae bacterium]